MKKLLCCLFVLCLCAPVTAQDDFFNPVEQSSQQSTAPRQLIDGNVPAEAGLNGNRLSAIMNALSIAKDERKTITAEMAELKAERRKLLDVIRELRDSNGGLLTELKNGRVERKGLLTQIADMRKERREAWKEWRRETRELWNERFKALAETQGPIRQTLTLLVRLFMAMIIFAGVVGLGVIGFWVWGKLSG